MYEVETEKVLYEVEAPASGTLAAALFPEGATVECGVVIAVIAESGEDATAVGARYGNGGAPAGAPAASAGAPAGAAVASHGAAASAAGSSAAVSAADDSGARRAISPVARKLAAELGVELARVAGTGPGGRITREDVERAAAAARSASGTAGANARGARAPSMPPPAAAAPAGAPGACRRCRGGGQTALAQHPDARDAQDYRRSDAQSLRESAQLTITSEADVTPAVELRERLVRRVRFHLHRPADPGGGARDCCVIRG